MIATRIIVDTKSLNNESSEPIMDLFRLMSQSPFHRWLGIELVRAQEGEVEVRLPYRAEFSADDSGSHIHGGIIASLADTACVFAVMSTCDQVVPMLDLRLDFLRMAKPGDDLIAVARTLKTGRIIAVADTEIRTADGQLIAVGRASVVTATR